MAKPWDRMTREGARSFAAFSKFLELGPDRTLKQTALETGIPENKVRTLSAQWNWRDRALAWEDHLAEEQRKRAERVLTKDAEKWAYRRTKLREDEYSTAERLIARANQILDLPLVESTIVTEHRIVKGEAIPVQITIVKPIRVTQRDAGSLARDASHLLRMSAEMETSRDRTDVNIMSEPEKLERAQKVLEKIRDEIMSTLNQQDPGLIKTVMLQLPEWIGEKFEVDPKSLSMDNISRAPHEESVEGEIVEEEASTEDLEEFPFPPIDVDLSEGSHKEL
jgi:hypothetical protein